MKHWTPLRRAGKSTARRTAALRRILPELRRRANNACENPLCGRRAKLDSHHVPKRSHSVPGLENLATIVLLCRPCHDWTEFPRTHSLGRLGIQWNPGQGRHEFFIERVHTRLPL